MYKDNFFNSTILTYLCSMFTKKKIFVLAILTAFAVLVVTSCSDYKQVDVIDASIPSFGNIGMTDGKVNADVVIKVVFNNPSGSEFSLKKGTVNLYNTKTDKLFATLTTGQSPVLKPHCKDTISFKCKAVCYNPMAALTIGLTSVSGAMQDEMTVTADLVATQGNISKRVKVEDIPLKELLDKFTKKNKK